MNRENTPLSIEEGKTTDDVVDRAYRVYILALLEKHGIEAVPETPIEELFAQALAWAPVVLSRSDFAVRVHYLVPAGGGEGERR